MMINLIMIRRMFSFIYFIFGVLQKILLLLDKYFVIKITF